MANGWDSNSLKVHRVSAVNFMNALLDMKESISQQIAKQENSYSTTFSLKIKCKIYRVVTNSVFVLASIRNIGSNQYYIHNDSDKSPIPYTTLPPGTLPLQNSLSLSTNPATLMVMGIPIESLRLHCALLRKGEQWTSLYGHSSRCNFRTSVQVKKSLTTFWFHANEVVNTSKWIESLMRGKAVVCLLLTKEREQWERFKE